MSWLHRWLGGGRTRPLRLVVRSGDVVFITPVPSVNDAPAVLTKMALDARRDGEDVPQAALDVISLAIELGDHQGEMLLDGQRVQWSLTGGG